MTTPTHDPRAALRDAIAACGISYQSLAELIGYASRQSVYDYLNGDQDLPHAKYVAALEACRQWREWTRAKPTPLILNAP